MGTYTEQLELYKPTNGEKQWGDKVNANWTKIDMASGWGNGETTSLIKSNSTNAVAIKLRAALNSSSELSTITSPVENDMALVKASTNVSESTLYHYNGTEWVSNGNPLPNRLYQVEGTAETYYYDTYQHNVSLSPFEKYTISKTLTVTTEWQDTGIAYNNLPTGSYMVAVSGITSAASNLWSETSTGVMSWYADGTNSGNADEITLHMTGHASNSNGIYLRTIRSGRTAGTNLRLQIKSKVNFTQSSPVNFTFLRLI